MFPLIRTFALAAASAASLLAGCASTNVDAQWRNIELPPGYLRGATVLVGCETGELVLKRLCEDRLVTELGARGVRAVLAPDNAAAPVPSPAPVAGVADLQYLTAARASGAKAVFGVSVGLASQSVSPGLSIGIGGFGFGRHSAAGIGVSAPIGGGQVNAGYALNGRVTDVASSRLMWTARASTPPSSDVNAQLADLAKSLVDAAAGAGLF